MPQTKQYMQRSVSQRGLRHGRGPDPGLPLTGTGVEQYLEACRTEGRAEGTLQSYRRGLERLYEDLPEGKTICRGTLEWWRESLLERGYAPSTVNGFLSVANAWLDFMGHREYQAAGQVKGEGDLQPELSRGEYLRLLQTARALDREKVYLLVKLFATTGLTVQELSKVTVEAAQEGKIAVQANKVKQVVRIPECLQKELLSYAGRNGCRSGPIFLTREGTPMSRTYVSTIIRQLCEDARVPGEKGNPRCLKRLYQSTRSGIENNIALLVEQAQNRLLEQEQLSIGWGEQGE